jgi:hypothetical protein
VNAGPRFTPAARSSARRLIPRLGGVHRPHEVTLGGTAKPVQRLRPLADDSRDYLTGLIDPGPILRGTRQSDFRPGERRIFWWTRIAGLPRPRPRAGCGICVLYGGRRRKKEIRFLRCTRG